MAKKDPVPQEEIIHQGKGEKKEKEKEKVKEKESNKVSDDSKNRFTEVKNANASGMGSIGKEVEE